MNYSRLIQQLTLFGFTKSQASLYAAGLELEACLMTHLALKANVRRSTAYYLMGELLRRGFFIKKKIGKRYYYAAASPEKLLAMTKKRERLIRRLLPELKRLSR